MANERRGYVSEAVLVAALERLDYKFGRTLHWGQTPTNLHVCTSDVTIGSNTDRPLALFQVTSSGYAGNYQMKFWRDMGELIEVKRVMPTTRVLSVLFEEGLKDKLVQISDFISDGAIRVFSLPNGASLLQKISDLADGELPAGREARLDYVKQRISRSDLLPLSKALKAALAKKARQWRLDPNLSPTPATFDTINIRRAILVGALFATSRDLHSAECFFSAAERRARLPQANFLQSLVEIGVCQKTIGGVRVVDVDLLKALDKLGSERFASISDATLNENAESRWFDYVSMIHLLPNAIPVWFEALMKHLDVLCTPLELAEVIRNNYFDPSLWQPRGMPKPPEPWIFRRLLDLIRVVGGKHFGFGIPAFDREFTRRGMQAFRFVISDYIAGRRCLTEIEAKVAAEVIAAEIKRVRNSVVPSLLDQFSEFVRRAEFQQRLMAYRGFDPLPLIVRGRINCVPDRLTPPLVQEIAVSGAASCDAFMGNDVVAMWQSASEQGVAHKVNELVGRMGLLCLRRIFVRGEEAFVFDGDRPNRVIYVDGAWGRGEVAALLSGCFTEVRAVI